MVSLKKRIVMSFGISLGILLIFVSVIIFYGLNAALKGWNRAAVDRYTTAVTRTLDKFFDDYTPQSKYPENDEIIKAVQKHLDDRFTLVLVNPDGEVILSHNVKNDAALFFQQRNLDLKREQSGSSNPTEAEKETAGKKEISKDFIANSARHFKQVKVNGSVKIYIYTRYIQFSTSEDINHRLLRSVFITLLLGIAASFAATMIFTSFITSKITKAAEGVSAGLKKMAGGARDVCFHETSEKEIALIASSALVLQKKLAVEEEARKQWTQDIAHDLRTPVAAIRSQIEAISDGIFKPEPGRFKKLLAETSRLEVLIEDVNRLTSIESPDALEETNFSEVSSTCFADLLKERFDIAAKEKNIKFDFEIISFKLMCDIRQITRALSNVVQNSIQYSRENSTVDIKFYTQNNASAGLGTDALIEGNTIVSDGVVEKTCAVFEIENSAHIPEDELPKIFQRFYRGEFSRSTAGSGLGLTITKAIVEKHGGTIKVYNTQKADEMRVCFKILLPMQG